MSWALGKHRRGVTLEDGRGVSKSEERWMKLGKGERRSQLKFTFEMTVTEGKGSCEKLLLSVRNEMSCTLGFNLTRLIPNSSSSG